MSASEKPKRVWTLANLIIVNLTDYSFYVKMYGKKTFENWFVCFNLLQIL
jgi:hypothetical protein